MKKIRKTRKKYKSTWKDNFYEALGEMALCVVTFALTIIIAALFPRESVSKLSFEIFLFLAFILICLLGGLVFAVVTVVKSRRKYALEQRHKKCCSTVEELYRALSPVSDSLSLNEDKGELLIKIDSDELAIYGESLGYRVCLNDKTDAVGVCDKDIYYYALEFLHDNRKDVCALEIYDTQISQIDDTGITYKDDFDRSKYIIFNDCLNDENDTRVGTYDPKANTVSFSIPRARVSVVFRKALARKNRGAPLSGLRRARLRALKDRVDSYGYTLTQAESIDK